MALTWGAVIVAAGKGTRFGRPKQLEEVAGAPLVAWSLRTLATMPEVSDLAIVTEPDIIEPMKALAASVVGEKPFVVVPGAETRQGSANAGLEALPEACDGVLIHDGARPLVLASDVRNAMATVQDGRAAVLGTPVVDTIKVVAEKRSQVVRTLDREELWAAQTPQLATRHDLRRAHIEALKHEVPASDDATLLERLGLEVIMVPGSPDNFKVTHPEDLARAAYLLRERAPITSELEEIVMLEAFVAEDSVEAVCAEIERQEGKVDGIDRDLPAGVVIRAYVPSERVAAFAEDFEGVAGPKATYTTRFAHFAPRVASAPFAGAPTG
ncbi:MAG: 2-C-methyl-D-erythritol 4-phosphate cytidylyltransferase [Candidatus Eremiobacteraeota bacterium]|nr:2-C-methyl-D-erythritol 4-phosphate cytidylyltransferase [Candidatus Eremiobacteraeota bacterium]